MDLGIAGKTALITASSMGMGRNIAHTLAAEGANVVLFARSADKLRSVAEELQALHKVRAIAVSGDLLATEDIDRLADTMAHSIGAPDILILNTGRAPNPLRATLDENETQRWQQAYENQLLSVINVANRVVPTMRGKGWGRIVAITSASVKEPMAHHSLSTVFRAGVTAYMKHLANELGAEGITVNCVAPALIDTSHRVGAAAYSPAQTEARKALTPLHRMGLQEEVCGVVAFLASRQAGFITGTTLCVDGGMVSSLL